MKTHDYDAVIVGAGPNGLAAAITLQNAGLTTLLLEATDTIGGGLRSAQLTLPGFTHDVCSAVHPMALMSPFFKTLPLAKYGLEFVMPAAAAGHPMDSGRGVVVSKSLEETAAGLGDDGHVYLEMMMPMVERWPGIAANVLAPLGIPKHPIDMAAFGLLALRTAESIANKFKTPEARAMWAGMTAHALQPLNNISSAAIGFVLLIAAHREGWPIPKGGSQQIANAMAAHLVSLGGKIETNVKVGSLGQLPSAKAVLFDVTPRQLLKIAGHSFSPLYQRQLSRYRYGMGVFKIDWALDGPIPFTSENCRTAGTIHIGNSFEEIAESEDMAWNGKHSVKPYVLLSQPSLFDKTRAPEGKHTAWAYCHVPHGSTKDMTTIIEDQVERFAPGFRSRIIGKHTFNTAQLEEYNANYVGGDINGGAIDIGQLFTRPVLRWSPYRTSARGLYICSSSTPPGGGVHGMCGYHAAMRAIRDCF